LHDHLVESEAPAAGLDNPGASRLREPESCNCDLGHVKHALVISNGADNDCGAFLLAAKVFKELAEGEWRAVGARRDQSPEDGLREVGASPAVQESEQLHTKRVRWSGFVTLMRRCWYRFLLLVFCLFLFLILPLEAKSMPILPCAYVYIK